MFFYVNKIILMNKSKIIKNLDFINIIILVSILHENVNFITYNFQSYQL
jgi:hypothetical protein